jgi:hypothetical protein
MVIIVQYYTVKGKRQRYTSVRSGKYAQTPKELASKRKNRAPRQWNIGRCNNV